MDLVLVLILTSFFGDQEGQFELGITSIAALRLERYMDHPENEDNEYFDEKLGAFVQQRPTWFGWFTSCLGCR